MCLLRKAEFFLRKQRDYKIEHRIILLFIFEDSKKPLSLIKQFYLTLTKQNGYFRKK